MGDAGDILPLLCGSRAHQCTGCDKQHLMQFPCTHTLEDVRAQHRRATAASRAAGIDVLLFEVEYHQSAVTMHTLNAAVVLDFKQLVQQLCAGIPQITGEYQVVVLLGCACIGQKVIYSPRRSRCRCQYKTINSPFFVQFVKYCGCFWCKITRIYNKSSYYSPKIS